MSQPTLIIQRSRLGSLTIYSAWEPSAIMGRHSTITTFGAEWYGKIGTDPDPVLYDRLPAWSAERAVACDEAYRARYEVAYAAILAQYPEAAAGERRDGEIIVDGASARELVERLQQAVVAGDHRRAEAIRGRLTSIRVSD